MVIDPIGLVVFLLLIIIHNGILNKASSGKDAGDLLNTFFHFLNFPLPFPLRTPPPSQRDLVCRIKFASSAAGIV